MNSLEIKQPEIKEEYIVTPNDIISALAYWAIRQSPYWVPKNLQLALEAAQKHIVKMYDESDKKSIQSYKSRSLKDISSCIKSVIFDVPEIAIWNVTQVEIDNGITDPDDPSRSVRFGMVGRGITTPEDKDFIDLDALHRNVLEQVLTRN